MNFEKLITSSADPRALSLTVKGILVAVLPFLLMVTGLPEADANAIIEVVVDVVFYGSTLLSLIMTGYGLIRKALNGRWSA
jgi:hypothetical protein